MRKWFLIGLGLASLWMASLHSWPAHAVDVREKGKEAVDFSVDTALTAEIKGKFLLEKDLDSFDIKVKTSHGVVILRGQVESEHQSALAERIARETKGVSRVVNKISVEQ